jgi:hypothetical protein
MTTTSMACRRTTSTPHGGSADLIQIGQQVCGAISPNVSPSVLTQDIYGRNVYNGRIHPLSWRRAYPCHFGAGRHFGSVRGRRLLLRRRGRRLLGCVEIPTPRIRARHRRTLARYRPVGPAVVVASSPDKNPQDKQPDNCGSTRP